MTWLFSATREGKKIQISADEKLSKIGSELNKIPRAWNEKNKQLRERGQPAIAI